MAFLLKVSCQEAPDLSSGPRTPSQCPPLAVQLPPGPVTLLQGCRLGVYPYLSLQGTH